MTTLTTAMAAEMFVDGSPQERVSLHAMWQPEDPLVVSLMFTYEGDGTNEIWEVSRDLLIAADGSTGLVGAGCFRVKAQGTCVTFSRHTDAGHWAASVICRREQLSWMLAESIRECMPGSEDERTTVREAAAQALADLLGGAA